MSRPNAQLKTSITYTWSPAREELPGFVDAQTIRDSIGNLNTDNIDFTRLQRAGCQTS